MGIIPVSRNQRSNGDPEVVVFYAGKSLARQLSRWQSGESDWRIHRSTARTRPGVRKALRNASLALLDATEDAPQAARTFSVAVTRLGGYGVAVYTERLQRWLELFVRAQGAVLLFGPLEDSQWEEFFEQMRRCRRKLPWWKLTGRAAAKRPVRDEEDIEEEMTNRFLSASASRTNTGAH